MCITGYPWLQVFIVKDDAYAQAPDVWSNTTANNDINNEDDK